jgi:hypothetical protein
MAIHAMAAACRRTIFDLLAASRPDHVLLPIAASP